MKDKTCLKRIPHIKKIISLAKKRKIGLWLVGGFLRDIYLKKNKNLVDFDFCVGKKVRPLARQVAKAAGAKAIVLDKKAPSLRVVLNKENKLYSYDFTRMRGGSLKADLAARDFTINTLALDLSAPGPLLDYYRAKRDLRIKKIKALSEDSITDDPLRILRGFSFAAGYGFKIDKKTIGFFSRHKGLIKNTSGERINEELFKILSAPLSYKTVRMMDKYKVVDQIIPSVGKMRKTGQGGFHHLKVWPHSLETLKQFELLYRRKLKADQRIYAYLNQDLAKGRKRIQILKLACLLHDAGKPLVKRKTKKRTIFHTHENVGCQIASRFSQEIRLSKNEKQSLEKMVFWHLRPGYLADQVTPSRRAVYRFFRDTAEEGAAVIFLSLADWRATCGPLTDPLKRKRHERVMFRLVKKYFIQRESRPPAKLIDGYDIMNSLSIKSSPAVGRILAEIKEQQAERKIKTKAQALKAAERIWQKEAGRQ